MSVRTLLALTTFVLLCYRPVAAQPPIDARDWPTYNHDVLGTRFNPAEKTLSPANAGRLEEKWRFPAKDSRQDIGVIHATPTVVNGHAYFGTATDGAFYKVSPSGKLCWSYRNPAFQTGLAALLNPTFSRFLNGLGSIMSSALVHENTVYFADNSGWIYALDRATGKDRWKRSSAAADWPDPHPFNVVIASPIMAGNQLIVCGGALEQVMMAALPLYRGATGRGFVVALEPATGKILWKYDLGPKPQRLAPPIHIKDSWGDHVFYYGPATSTIWSTPSYDSATQTLYFGTDVNTAPRRPTTDNPRTDTPESCAVVALNATTGTPRWIRQINPGDVWTNAMRSYDPEKKQYKDQATGDTPKIYQIEHNGKPTKVIGVGCKNGGFYVIDARSGEIVAQTPIYTGPPSYPLNPTPDPRMLALPSCIGGLQTGCATDGKTIYTNGIDALKLMSQESLGASAIPPTAGRVVAISLDTKTEKWRHERPIVAELGGPPPKPVFRNAGDPVASGIAVANGLVIFTAVASGTLNVLDASDGRTLKQFTIGPVWSGPSISRGRIYCGSGNTLIMPSDLDSFFPKRTSGTLFCYGLPGTDDVSAIAEEPH